MEKVSKDKHKDLINNGSQECDTSKGSPHMERICLSDRKKKSYKHNQCLLKQKKPELVPPDGGWGWVIIIGGFVTMICASLPLFGFSILFSPLLKSSVSSSKIAWIISVHGLVWNFAALLVGPLSAELGWRKLGLVGGILNFLSVFMSVFVTNPDFLFFTYAVLGGIGGSAGFSLCFIVVSRYFLKHRGFALAAASLGVCVGAFLSPVIANYLLEHYGYKGATLIYGGLVLNQCVGSAFFQPVEWHMKPAGHPDIEYESKPNEDKLLHDNREQEDIKCQLKEKCCPQSFSSNKMLSLPLEDIRRLSAFSMHSTVSLGTSIIDIKAINSTSKGLERAPKSKNICEFLKRVIESTYESILTLKYLRVQIICLGAGCLSIGYVNFQMWIPFVIRNAGYSLEMSAWCVSSSSIANIIARVILSFLSDRKWFNIKFGYMFGMFLLGLSIIVFSFVEEITLFLICVCCWGLGIGIAYSLMATIYIATMGVESFPAVFGVSSLFVAVFSIAFGPIVGIIRDMTSSYTYALCFLGVAEWIGFVAWLFMPFAILYDEKTILKNKLKEVQEIT